MDPDTVLYRIRERLAAIDREEDRDLHLQFLAEEFGHLDKWITDGGFLPSDWDNSKE